MGEKAVIRASKRFASMKRRIPLSWQGIKELADGAREAGLEFWGRIQNAHENRCI